MSSLINITYLLTYVYVYCITYQYVACHHVDTQLQSLSRLNLHLHIKYKLVLHYSS